MTVDEFFAASPLGRSVFKRVQTILGGPDQIGVRVSKSQLAFRRRRAIAYLWKPGQYLASPAAEVVLSIPLRRRIDSSRFKEVVQPAKGTWMHHLEIRRL